ncbi:polysaccharide deacetylase family protein [Hymenobacter fastidiosus]|uniref:polysaccharide deacetylase family protein n=1 Tax=Hymenobacter fastidiosus TaxID=486264 RepID=UPI0031F085B7
MSASVFEQQLAYLAKNQWTVIDLDTFLKGFEQPEILPDQAVLITFDDGYRSNLIVALPLLRQFSYPGVIFVPTGFIDGYNAFDADIFYEPEEPICSWEELKELERQGVSVQSHGVWHRHFSTLSVAEQVVEVVQSKAEIEARLNKTLKVFSFPYGDDGLNSSQTEELLAEAGYRAACLYNGTSFEVKSALPYRLERIPIGPDTDMSLVLKLDNCSTRG